ncbi:MAG: hypothetical protein IJM02_05485 [Clostridia bacterium]|nr:hypothetical protein [Clostridia bacterium]
MTVLGYVKACKSEMKVAEYEIYKGVYCSLCKALGRYYGPLGKMLLSYDYAFAAVIRLAVASPSCTFTRKRCPFNPLHKCYFCENKAETDLCAHGAVITAYYKIKDNLHDPGFGKKIVSLLLLPVVSLMHRKAKRLAPEIENIISESMVRQAETEKAENPGIDECADPTAQALGKLFAVGESENTAGLERLGYLTGRLVYIMDAADDLEKDIKTGAFNPFAEEYRDISNPEVRRKFASYALSLINLTQASLIEACKELKFNRFESIAENVIYDGLTAAAERIVSKYTEKEKTPDSFTVE